MDGLYALYPLLRTIWIVWFFVLFVGILAWALWPGRRQRLQQLADIPLRDDARPGR
ncbi:cbb3-type cytochrome c oxidase subunit 3 [Roseomonas sp. NAR14]|uniref:Cbb3-type cytochrome c oxidase subunit 3 n=1 Tax=Roseomonas acroporae TaxID=2937791 RepID=A0A9X1Y9U7_9PROT|nr:cbb3-type cytochrome c oxidase subunit 3 [Roseomonas acroporae]MCK8784772.1 cbb3-type cytochrome c oxidase subunit 3 [Roseomonas acroporae]